MAQDREWQRRGLRRATALRASAVSVAVGAMMACGEGDRPGPTGVDQAAPLEAAVTAAATPPGIVFSASQLPLAQLNSVNTGLVYTPTPSNLLSFLSQVKSKNGRVLIKLAGGE